MNRRKPKQMNEFQIFEYEDEIELLMRVYEFESPWFCNKNDVRKWRKAFWEWMGYDEDEIEGFLSNITLMDDDYELGKREAHNDVQDFFDDFQFLFECGLIEKKDMDDPYFDCAR